MTTVTMTTVTISVVTYFTSLQIHNKFYRLIFQLLHLMELQSVLVDLQILLLHLAQMLLFTVHPVVLLLLALNGVMIVPGGRFAISETTLPGAVISSVLNIY